MDPVGRDRQVDEAAGAQTLRRLDQLVDLAAARRAQAGHGDALDPPAGGQGLVEDAEARGRAPVRAAQDRGKVDELHAEPEVGLVGSETLERLVVGEARKGHVLEGPLGGDGAGDRDRHGLDEVHHRVLGDEAHLEVELGELRLPIAAEILVPEAARDLVVAVQARDHEELLELLGALRQGIDGARLEARRNDEVAGTFGRALDEDGCLDLDEPVLLVGAPDLRHELRPEEKPAQHRLSPDVQVAVLEADRLLHRSVRLVDVEGRRPRLGEDREGAGLELDLTCRQAVVLHARQAAGDVSLDRDHELGPAAGSDGVGVGRVGRVHDDLGEPVAVAHVEEDELAVIAATVNPAGQANRAALVDGAKGAAGVRPVRGGEARGGLGHGPRMVAARPRRAWRPRLTLLRARLRLRASSDAGAQRDRPAARASATRRRGPGAGRHPWRARRPGSPRSGRPP